MLHVKRILIAGVPFAGKTYISSALKKQGLNAVDADYIEGLSYFLDSEGHDCTEETLKGAAGKPRHRYWKLRELSTFLDQQKEPVLVFGWAANVWDACELFDQTFYLGLKQEELERRFKHNVREHTYGTFPGQKSKIRHMHKISLDKAINDHIRVIDATLSPEQIGKELSAHVAHRSTVST